MTAKNYEMAARMPWLYAESGSYWIATGTIGERHTFTDCIIRAVPAEITGMDDGDELALFEVLTFGGERKFVSADRVGAARRLVFVLAESPNEALYLHEQDFLEAAVTA